MSKQHTEKTTKSGVSRRNFLTAVGVTGMAVAGGSLLAACTPKTITSNGTAPAAPTNTPQLPSTLTIAQGTDVEAWSPYAHSTTTTYGLWQNMLEPLVDYDFDKGQFRGILAESWSTADDKLTWTFKLRQGVLFHDGTEFTANDVIHSFNRILHDKDSKQAPTINTIASMSAPDKYTVVIKTKGPDAALLQRVMSRHITSEANFKKYGTAEEADKHPTGTGPYVFMEWQRGNRFVIARNTKYRDGAPAIEKVSYKPIPEASTRITALEAGEADLINTVPPHEVDRIKSSGKLRIESVESLRMMFVPFNPSFKPLDNKNVRLALIQAVDVDSLIKNVLDGQAYRMTTPVGRQIFGFDPKATPLPYDPEKAKAMLKEAGFANGFSIDFYSPNGRYTKDLELSQAIAGMLGKVGVKVNVKTPEWGIFASQLEEGKFPMYLIGRGGVVDASEYLAQYWETGVTKRTSFSNPDVDALLRSERQTFGPDRAQQLQKAAGKIYEEGAALFLFTYQDNYGAKANLEWKARPDEYMLAGGAKYKA